MKKILALIKKDYKGLTGSLLLALLLWVAIKSDDEFSHTVDVPIVITTLGDNLVLKKLPPSFVKLKIKGSGRSLFGLSFTDEKINLEFPQITKDQVVDLEEYIDKFQFPEDLNIQVISVISPKKIFFEVDQLIIRRIPVKISEEIKPEAGHLLVSYKPDVDSVTVTGPATFVNAMEFIETSKVSMTNIRLPFEQTVHLINEYPEVISISPELINVNFNIEPLVERTIYNIPIRIINVPNNISAEATPATISVRVKGGETQVSALLIENIEALFNYGNQFISGKTTYPMQIKTPEKVTWVKVSPTTFSLKLFRKEGSR